MSVMASITFTSPWPWALYFVLVIIRYSRGQESDRTGMERGGRAEEEQDIRWDDLYDDGCGVDDMNDDV